MAIATSFGSHQMEGGLFVATKMQRAVRPFSSLYLLMAMS